MTSTLALTSPSGTASICVDCENGGRISSFSIYGRELTIVGAASPLNWGIYPMVPFAGRVRNSLLQFEDRAAQLPANNGPHAIHGYGFIRPWTVIDEHTIEFAFGEPWPWQGSAVQTFELTDTLLALTLRVDAVERQPMQIGWHPWFRRSIGNDHEIELDFHPAEMFELGSDAIPTGQLIPVPDGPWDNCFDGVHTDPRVSWGDLELTLSSTLEQWTVFDEHPDGVCVEPQLGPPNAVNHAPEILDAGESMEATFTISWE